MIFDRPTFAIQIGSCKDNLVVSCLYGCERTGDIIAAEQYASPKPEIPLGKGRLCQVDFTANVTFTESYQDLLENVWRIWESKRYTGLRKNTRNPAQSCLSISKASFTYELFTQIINKDAQRKFAGPNPITDIRSFLKLPGCPMWKKTDKVREFLVKFWSLKKQLIETPLQLFKEKPLVISFDVEAWGILGEHPFAIGGAVYHEKDCLETWHFTCPPGSALPDDHVTEKDKTWVRKNVLPHHPEETTYCNPDEIVEAFKNRVAYWKKKNPNTLFVVDRGFPLEVRLLNRAGFEPNFFDVQAWAQVFNIELVRDKTMFPPHNPKDDSKWAHHVFQMILSTIEK